MACLVSTLKIANSNLHFEKEVVERRAEMAAQCECLAMWIEGRECICDKAVEAPLSTENLKTAHSLIGQIEGCDKRLTLVGAIKGANASCAVELDGKKMHQQNGMVFYSDDDGGYCNRPIVTLPKAVLIAALKEERIKLMIALNETGIVSVARNNIKVTPE